MTNDDMIFAFYSIFEPLTNRLSFIDAPITEVMCAYENLMNPVPLQKIEHDEDFLQLLELALPFNYPRKDVFFETEGKWTGFFANVISEVSVCKDIADVLNTEMVSVHSCPLTRTKEEISAWGGGIFYFHRNNELKEIILSGDISLIFDCQKESAYRANMHQCAVNQYTPETTNKYLQNMDLNFFNDDFYLPQDGKAYIMEHLRPPFENEKPISLDDMIKHLISTLNTDNE